MTRELSCQEWVELVTAYLDGSLPRRVRRSVDRHLAGCAGCRDYLDQMRTTIELTGKPEAVEPPSPLREQLLEAFRDWKRTRE